MKYEVIQQMLSDAKLKPCPFCGSLPLISHSGLVDMGYYIRVACLEATCKVSPKVSLPADTWTPETGTVSIADKTIPEIVAIWNTRHEA